MKELSIEEKAKLYDEAIIRGSRLWESDMITRENFEYIFPEVKESEDERIRKQITGFITYSRVLDETKKNWLAWLEKQGENGTNGNEREFPIPEPPLTLKHAKEVMGIKHNDAWSEEDKRIILAISQLLKDCESENGWNCVYSNDREVFFADIENYLQSLKNRIVPQPKQEWSEEDEYCRHQLIVFCENCMVKDDGAKRCAHWLKSLRPQNTWKPSELQIEALESATENCAYSEYQDCLRELTGLLKKLMEGKL